MDTIFLSKLVLSFVVGGILVTLTTIIAEKAGTKLGGVLSMLPIPMGISLFFIALIHTNLVAAEATTIIPLAGAINSIYILFYIFLLRSNNFYMTISLSFSSWLIMAASLIILNPTNFIFSILGAILIVVGCYLVVENKLHTKSENRRIVKYTFSQILFRAILSGSIITAAIFMTKIGGPVFGGIFATFPTIMSSTMIITYLSHGKDFSSAVMKILMVAGPINGTVYAIVVRYSYPVFGLFFGTIVSFIVSLVSACIVYKFVNKNMS